MSCTCGAGPARLLQLVEAFGQNGLAAGHPLLHALLLASQAAHTTHTYSLGGAWLKEHVLMRMLFTHSPVRDCHCLGVGGGDHEADGRGCELMSSSVLHVPFGPVVPEQSVPLPTQNRPLCTSDY